MTATGQTELSAATPRQLGQAPGVQEAKRPHEQDRPEDQGS